MNTLMFLQPYEMNNILIIKYFICMYNVITNGTFTFWLNSLTNYQYYKTFTFQAKIENLCFLDTDDIFFQLEPHWPDIIIRPNLVCNSFILMCKCLNQYDINTNPIVIDNPSDYTVDLLTSDGSETESDDDNNDELINNLRSIDATN